MPPYAGSCECLLLPHQSFALVLSLNPVLPLLCSSHRQVRIIKKTYQRINHPHSLTIWLPLNLPLETLNASPSLRVSPF